MAVGRSFTSACAFDRDGLIVHQVANGRIDHDLIAETCILAGDENVGIAELGHAAQHIRIHRGLRARREDRKAPGGAGR